MRILYILEKILTGKKVKFIEGVITAGARKDNKVIILHDLEREKKFIIGASLNNFIRFKKWIGKEAVADYEPYLRPIKTDQGLLTAVRLSTTVEIDDYKERNNFDDYDL